MDAQQGVTIIIPTPIASRIKEHIKDTSFDSVSAYVTYILRQVLAKMELVKGQEKNEYNSEQKKEIKKDLKAMGYL